jgi:hypothetical protein
MTKRVVKIVNNNVFYAKGTKWTECCPFAEKEDLSQVEVKVYGKTEETLIRTVDAATYIEEKLKAKKEKEDAIDGVYTIWVNGSATSMVCRVTRTREEAEALLNNNPCLVHTKSLSSDEYWEIDYDKVEDEKFEDEREEGIEGVILLNGHKYDADDESVGYLVPLILGNDDCGDGAISFFVSKVPYDEAFVSYSVG